MHRLSLSGLDGLVCRLVFSVLIVSCLATGRAFAQRDLTEIPAPDPVAEMAAMKVADEAVVNLFAADPDIRKPIQINFDSRGRLWVASSEVYPQIKPGEIANDKILVLEDTTGDGVCDVSTVFADGLLIPTGVVPDEQGGAYVAASTELLHFADTDGDGVADQRRVVLSGFGTEDTHHLIHTLRWGPDGCLYFNQSIYIHSHVETAFGTRHLDGGGIWRYRPDTGELSVLCKGFVNPWGHVFDAHGESFATDGAYFEGINYVFPDSVFVKSPGELRWLGGMNPGSPKHCGLEVISGSHFPESWWGDLVTNDFRGQRVCRFTVRPAGSHYTSRQQPEVLTSSHIAFRPIDARMGPDGALYVADWYNPIIQHGEVDFRDERRDRERGRVWRVHMPGRPLDSLPDFEAASTDGLIELLEHPSLAVRQFARQHLWSRVRQNAGEVLEAVSLWRDAATDESRLATRSLEHQWLGEVAGQFALDAFEIVAGMQPGSVARTSLRSAVRSGGLEHPAVAARITASALGDHAASRLEAVVALGQAESGAASIEATKTLLEVAQRFGEGADDPLLDFALWQSFRRLSGSWIEAIREDRLAWQPHAAGLAYAVSAAASSAAADAVLPLLQQRELGDAQKRPLIAAIAASGDPATLGKLLALALKAAVADGEPWEDTWVATLDQLVQRSGRDRVVPQDAATLLSERFPAADSLPAEPKLRHLVITAAGLWKAESMLPALLAIASSPAPGESLLPTLRALSNFEAAAAADELNRWATRGNGLGNPAAAIEAAVALASRRPNLAAQAVVGLLDELSADQDASRLLLALRTNQAVAGQVAERLNQAELSRPRAQSLLSAVRNAGGSELLEAAIHAAGRLDKAGWEPTPELAAEILAAASTHGDPAKGESIYRRAALQCVNCHAIGPAGGLVGPNLISLGSSSQPDYILESLWLPDARLKEGYNTLSVLTDDGRVTSGIPIGRGDSNLRLRLADGKEVDLPIDAIEDEQPGKSLMPAGSIDSLTRDELIHLVAFLRALGRDPAYTVSADSIVREFETLSFSKEAQQRLNRTSTDSVAVEDPVFQWRPVTTLVNGSLPISELDGFRQHATTPLLSFVRFHVVVPEGQEPPRIELPTGEIDLWVDGKPTPPAELASLKWSPGTHAIVLAINRDAFQGDFMIRLGQADAAKP
ncbi:MAG: L-sorbosone dehydrogenase [Planctomycetaceae bacterium]|nr:MAG: L-sorbosone dehydrogenase [Planctomycetaceae bacterium]